MHTHSVFAPNRWERKTWTEENKWKQRKIAFDPNKLELVTFFIRDRIVLILKRARMHLNRWCSIWTYLVKFLDTRFWPTPYHYRKLAVYLKRPDDSNRKHNEWYYRKSVKEKKRKREKEWDWSVQTKWNIFSLNCTLYFDVDRQSLWIPVKEYKPKWEKKITSSNEILIFIFYLISLWLFENLFSCNSEHKMMNISVGDITKYHFIRKCICISSGFQFVVRLAK